MTDKLYLKEKADLENKALFRAKDLGLLNEVKAYLNEHGMSGKLEGSIVKNLKKGYMRNYGDIDIAIETKEFNRSSEKFNDYVNVIRDLYHASKGNKNLKNWIVEDFTEQFAMYVGLIINYRFKIKNSKTNTEIDLSFGKKDKGALKDFRGRDITSYNF